MNKLFVKMGCSVPIQFRVTQNDDDDIREMKVRALLVYDVPDSYMDPVLRCPIHLGPTHKANQGSDFITNCTLVQWESSFIVVKKEKIILIMIAT